MAKQKKKPAKKKVAKKASKKKITAKKAAKKKAPAKKVRRVVLARPMIAAGAGIGMTLTAYRINPRTVDMPGIAISFSHDITLSGDDSPDTFCVDFSPITSPNWRIDGPLTRSFPVNTVGFHSFHDGLAFVLLPGGTRVKGEVFTVRAAGYLASKTSNKIRSSIVVTVR